MPVASPLSFCMPKSDFYSLMRVPLFVGFLVGCQLIEEMAAKPSQPLAVLLHLSLQQQQKGKASLATWDLAGGATTYLGRLPSSGSAQASASASPVLVSVARKHTLTSLKARRGGLCCCLAAWERRRGTPALEPYPAPRPKRPMGCGVAPRRARDWPFPEGGAPPG